MLTTAFAYVNRRAAGIGEYTSHIALDLCLWKLVTISPCSLDKDKKHKAW